MKAGEFTSVRAAALEAGLVRFTFPIPLDPDRAARAILCHFTGDDLAALVTALCRALPVEVP